MAKFDVDIEGATYEVDAPDEQTAWNWANQIREKEKAQIEQNVAQFQERPWYERAAKGAAGSLEKSYYGLKGLGTELSPEERQRIEELNLRSEKDTAASLGGLAADVGTFLIPGMGASAAGAKALTMLPRAAGLLSRARPAVQTALKMGGAAGIDAATAAAISPEDRGTAAAIGGLGSVGGQLLAKGIGRVAGGLIKPSEEAASLMKEGVNVPVWKASENKLLRGVAERLKALPITGTKIAQAERGAVEDFNRALNVKATPPKPILDEAGNVLRWEKGQEIKEIGTEGIGKIQDLFNDAYSALYKGRGIPVDNMYADEITATVTDVKKYYPRIADEVDAAIKQADDLLRKGTETVQEKWSIIDPNTNKPAITSKMGHAATSPESVKMAIDSLNKRITEAWKKGEESLATSLSAVRDSISDLRVRSLPPEVASMAKPINEAYVTFKQMQRAALSPAVQTKGVIGPAQMRSAIKSLDKTPGKSSFARGTAKNQPFTSQAEEVLGSTLPEVGPGTAEKLMANTALLAPQLLGYDLGLGITTAALASRPGQKALLGGYSKQKAIQDFLRRKSRAAGDIGAGLTYGMVE